MQTSVELIAYNEKIVHVEYFVSVENKLQRYISRLTTDCQFYVIRLKKEWEKKVGEKLWKITLTEGKKNVTAKGAVLLHKFTFSFSLSPLT